jgi:hypothetical protein
MIPVFTNKGGKFVNFQTILSVMQNLRNNQDLSVTKLIRNINERKDRKEKGAVLIDGITFDMDENIKLQIIDEMQLKLVLHTSLVSAIKYVLTEHYIPMPKALIIENIVNFGLLARDFVNACNFEEACKKDSTILYNIEHKLYYVKQEQKISTSEFIEQLKEREITNKTDYFEIFGGKFDDIYVMNPEDIYEGFKFVSLTEATYYTTIRDCVNAIKQLITNKQIKSQLSKLVTMNEKSRFLNQLNPLIPSNIIDVYGKNNISQFLNIFDNMRS